jgi:hypothetical protein
MRIQHGDQHLLICMGVLAHLTGHKELEFGCNIGVSMLVISTKQMRYLEAAYCTEQEPWGCFLSGKW